MASKSAIPPDPFDGPFLKLERAEHHIDKLEAVLARFTSDNLKAIRAKHNHSRRKKGQIERAAQMPRHASTILGDALHNLRVSLDHAYYISCVTNQATTGSFTRFPFGKDRASLEGSINGHKQKGFAPSDLIVSAIINDVQPYEGGRLGLYGLHRLDITDKHETLIPVARSVKLQNTRMINERGAEEFRIEGSITITTEDNNVMPFGMSAGSGFVLQGNPKNAFQVTFAQGQPFQGQSILKTIDSMRKATVEALNIIKSNI